MPEVKRNIDVEHWSDPVSRVQEAVLVLDGVRSVALDVSRRRLQVVYDDTRVGFTDIAQTLTDMGCKLRRGWWPDLKARWYGYLDGNAQANAADGGACCGNPTEVYSRRRKR